MREWLEEWWPAVLLGVLIVGLLALLLYYGIEKSAARTEACAHAMSLAATRRDSMDVVMRCEIQDEDNTVVVPMPIYVPSR